jgi:hypothetical protein
MWMPYALRRCGSLFVVYVVFFLWKQEYSLLVSKLNLRRIGQSLVLSDTTSAIISYCHFALRAVTRKSCGILSLASVLGSIPSLGDGATTPPPPPNNWRK